jgi:hypothetical protein
MEKPGMFRQTSGVVRRGISETAERATASPQSGFAAQIETPVWRSFVGHEEFQKSNRDAVDDEQRRLRDQDINRRREERAASTGPRWKSGIGKITATHRDGTVEEHDAEGLLDDPAVGRIAAESLFKRDLKGARDDVASWNLKLADPSDTRRLTAKERSEIEAEGSMLQETDPRHVELKGKLVADDERKSDEQKSYEAKTRLQEFSRGGVDSWLQRRQPAKPIAEQQAEVAQRNGELDAADQSAGRELQTIDEKLATGVRGGELPILQQRRGEVVSARGGIAAARAVPAAQAKQVAAESRKQADAMDGKPNYGARPDGSQKGSGWLGELKLPDGSVATEYTMQSDAVKVDGRRVDFPTLVPGLSPEEVQLMTSDIIPNKKEIPEPIIQKAIAHANLRLGEGKSVFTEGKAEPSRPVYEKLAGALQSAKLFNSATSAIQNATDKGIRRRADGDWDLPIIAPNDGGAVDAIGGLATTAGQKIGARLDSAGPIVDKKAIQKIFHDFQQANNLSDEEVSAAWSDLGNINRKWESGEGARVLSNGQLLPNAGNSDWLDDAKAKSIIDDSAASPEAKAQTLSNLSQIQEAIAQQRAQELTVASGSNVFGDSVPLFPAYAASVEGGIVEKVRGYEQKYLTNRGPIRRQFDEWRAANLAGQLKLGQTFLGVGGMMGSEGMGAEAASVAQASGLLKKGADVDGLLSAAIEEAPSMFVQIALTRGLGAGVGAVTGSARAANLAGTLGAFTTAGAQSAGITYSSELAQGSTPEKAREKAAKAGVNTAIITAAFGTGSAGGVERVAAGHAAEMTVRDLVALARQKGVISLARSPELRRFAGEVVKSTGGEAGEEGLDELLGAFVTSDPDTNLSDAWSNAIEAAKVGGFIGGAVDVAAGAIEEKDSKWHQQTVQSSPEDRRARVNAEMTAEDPTAVAATPEEVAAAEEVIGVFGAGPSSIELEDKIGMAEGVEADELRDQRGTTAAREVATGVYIVRELATAEEAAAAAVAAAAEQLESSKSFGDPPEFIEQREQEVQKAQGIAARVPRARGVLKISRGENLETLTDAEVRALGVTRDGKPLKEEELASVGLTKPLVDLGVDGSPVLLDEAVKDLESVAPTARGRVKMTESQARKKAVERKSAPAGVEPGVMGSPGAPAERTFTVTGRAGTVVEVQAADEASAEQAGAVALPMGEQVASIASADEAASSEASKQVTTADAPAGSVGDAPSMVGSAVKKRIARWKQRLGANMTVTADPSARAHASDAGIVINPSRLVDEATANGLDGAQAEAWVQSVIDEEVRHFAHHQAAQELWRQSGSKLSFEAWRSDYFGAMWVSEFAGQRGDTVRALYGEAAFDTLDPWQKAMEGLRMMSQKLATGAPTEVAKLWTNAGPRIIHAIREALRALKAMVSDLSPTLKAEIAAIEEQLSKYEQGSTPVSDRPAKPGPVLAPRGDGKAAGPRGKTADARETEQGGRRGVSQAPGGDQVTFEKDGEQRSGTVLRVSTDGSKTIVRTDVGNVLVATDELLRPAAEVASPLSIAGEKIDDEWTGFSADSGTLSIPRAEMPQIAAEDRSAMVQFLRARGIEYTDGRMLPTALKPTQAEFSARKVDKARGYIGGDRAILVSADGYLVDGHHQWLAKWFDAPAEAMRTIRLEAPIREILDTIKAMPSVETAEGAATPTPAANVEETPAGAWTPERQSEYRKLKTALTKAERAGDPSKVIEEAERGLAHFEEIGAYPDDWSRWERAKEDAQVAIKRAPKLSAGEQSLKTAFKGLVEGLEAAALKPEDFRKGIPAERIGQFITAAQGLIAEGVSTPGALAAALDKISSNLRPYSEAVWSAFRMVDPSLPTAVDWVTIYSPAEATDGPSDREEAFGNVSRDKKAAMASVIEEAERLALAGEPFTRTQAAEGDPKSALSKKEMDESIEAGITAAAHQIVSRTHDEVQAFARLLRLYEHQPSLTAKTSTSKIDQAYSTPVPLAYVATLLVEIDAGNDVVLEPTSGHSMLLMGVPANSTVLVNEINPGRRFRTLAAIPHSAKWEVSGEDATTWKPSKTPSKVISNPPFGQLMGEDGDNVVFQSPAGETTSIDHAIMLRSLESMADDGRAVFIIGGPPKTVKTDKGRRDYYGRGKQGGFFKFLHDNYGVVDHFTVSGDLYAKQGAGWNVDVIVIQGKERSRIALPSAKSPRMLSSWDDVFQTTTLTDEQRIQLNRISEEEMRASVRGMADRLAGIERMGRPEATGGRTAASRGQDSTRESTAEAPRDQGQARDNGSLVGVDGRSDDDARSASADVVERVEPVGEGAGTGSSARGSRDTVRSSGDVAAVGKFQAEYRPFSSAKGLDTLLPINMVDPVTDAFVRIKSDLGGDLVGFVRQELGYPKGTDISKYLAGEQIDAVAAAIWNFERGGALIIGDQTGIGKGRIAAALMKYAVNKGFTPIFMTQKPTLHDAMLTSDLPDIAGDDVIPAVMDTKLQFDSAREQKLNFGKDYFEQTARAGKLPGGANAVFVTYDQIQADDFPGLSKADRARARNNNEAPPHGWRLDALKALAPNAVIILDESHLASGQSTRGWRVADIIRRSSRVYYSSATSVKRPENMGIYFKTNVGALTGGNVDRIVEMMTAGGVPAMQVVSSMLARDGQYLRRERSFDGVKFTTQIAEESADRDRELADGLTSALRNIVTVQDAMTKAAAAINDVIAAAGKRMNVPAANRAKLETTNFSSKLHNIVGQYLLAIKTASAAEAAIRDVRAGKKVVVAVQSTMEAAIDGLEFGGFAMSYKGLVQRYLDQMRFLQSGNRRFGKGEVETFEIKGEAPEEFADLTSRDLEFRIVTTDRDEKTGDPVVLVNEKVAAELMRRAMWNVFEQARDQIDATDIGNLPISPIDAMRQAVERAGIRTGEITGRKRGIDENGEIYVRPPVEVGQQAQVNVKRGFNDEDLDFLVINQSGSTGISLHASEKAGNKAQRVMVVAQPNLDINEFMQTLGRIHRSGQVVKPEFILLQTALPAEKRPAAILGRKMAMLNANTTSNAKTDVSEGNSAIDIFNKYGDEVVYRIFERDADLQDQLRPLGSSLSKFFNAETGRAVPLSDAQRAVEEQPDGYIARTVTGYLVILPVDEQEHFWERTIADYQAFIAYLDQIGQNELEAKALDLSAKTISSQPFTERLEGESAFSEPSYLETVETKMGKTPLTGAEAVDISRMAKESSQQALREYIATADAFSKEAAEKKAKRSLKWDDDKREEFLASQRAQRNVVANALSLLGRFGTVKRDDGNTGLGVVEEIRIDESSPTTPSKQVAVIRVNDGRDTLRVPVTQLTDAFTPDPNESADEWQKTTDAGGERMIATGNLIAAMQSLSGTGKVVTYTTDSGDTRMGILLPNTFAARYEASKARISIDNAAKLLDRLDAGGTVTSSTGAVKWTRPMAGREILLTVPASRSRGGDYWRNPRLNALLTGGEFVERGGNMSGMLPRANVAEAFEILRGLGDSFHSTPETLEAAPLRYETAANTARLTEAGRSQMAGPEVAREARAQQEAFADQRKVVGNPDLANISEDETVRAEMDLVDEMRKFTQTREKKIAWEKEGRRLADTDEAGVVEKWLQNAYSDEGQAVRPEDVIAARVVMERRVKAAGNDIAKHAENAVLLHGYREARANQARVLAAGTDPFKKPDERHRDYLAGVLYSLPPRVVSGIEGRSKSPSAARAAIRKAVEERLGKIEGALKKMGVTLDEITGGQVFLSLSQASMMKDVVSKLSPAERTAVKAIQSGATLADVRKRSGLPEAKIQILASELRRQLAEKLRSKVAAGMKLEDLRDEMKALQAAALSEADIEAELDRILTVGFGIPKDIPTTRLPKRRRSKPVPLEKANWARPTFTDALAAYEFDTTDRSEIMARVTALRDVTGIPGRINALEGKSKVKAVRLVGEMNKILTKYGTSADKIMREGVDPDTYRFDISDRRHVMILARTIQALDADIVDKTTELYYSSLLSGLQTMIVNAAGGLNTIWQATVERGFEAAINLLVNDPEIATFGEIPHMLRAMKPMLARAWSNAAATWSTETPFFEEDILGRVPDLSRIEEGVTGYKTAAIGGKLGRVIRIPGRILMATDEFMNVARASAEVAAMAYRLARVTGLKPGTKEFDDFLKKEVNIAGSQSWQMAAQRALVGTFNNALPGQRNVAGKAEKIRTVTDMVGGAIYGLTHSKWLTVDSSDSITVKLLKTLPKLLFFPFVRVPFNILKQGIERSLNPVSLADMALLFAHNLRIRDGKLTINADGDKARIIEMVAKQTQGALLMLLLASLGEGDDDDLEKPLIVTGSRPFGDTKKGERELAYRLGLGPYEISMRLPGGKRIGFSYGRIEPAATVLGGTIDTLRNAKAAAKGRLTSGEAMSRILSSFVSQANDKTSLRGASDLQAILAGEKPLDRYAADRIASFMPNLIKQAVRESDPYFREKPTEFVEMLQRAAWPRGGSISRDIYGEEQDKKGTSAGRVIDFTDFGTEKIRDWDEMLWRYRQKNPTDFYAPQSPVTTYEHGGKSVKMNPAQAARFKELAGLRTVALLKLQPFNLTNPTELDRKRFEQTVTRARSEVKQALIKSATWRNLN